MAVDEFPKAGVGNLLFPYGMADVSTFSITEHDAIEPPLLFVFPLGEEGGVEREREREREGGETFCMETFFLFPVILVGEGDIISEILSVTVYSFYISWRL